MPQVSLMVPAVHTAFAALQSESVLQPARPLARRHVDGYQFAGTRRLERENMTINGAVESVVSNPLLSRVGRIMS